MRTPVSRNRAWPARALLAAAGVLHLAVAFGLHAGRAAADEEGFAELGLLAGIAALSWLAVVGSMGIAAVLFSLAGFVAVLASGESESRALAPALLVMAALALAEALAAPAWLVAAGAAAGLLLLLLPTRPVRRSESGRKATENGLPGPILAPRDTSRTPR